MLSWVLLPTMIVLKYSILPVTDFIVFIVTNVIYEEE